MILTREHCSVHRSLKPLASSKGARDENRQRKGHNMPGLGVGDALAEI